MPSDHLILCRPLLHPPSVFPSIRVFSNESVLCSPVRWTKYWSFSFSINPSNEYLGLIYFWMDWLDLLAVQGTFKSLLQHHRSKASILLHSAFFIVQLSHPYMTIGKTIALTKWTFVGKVMSLLLNMLSRLIITFFPRSKHLLIPWLQSSSAVILEPQKLKSDTVSTISPSICHEVMGPDAMIFVFWNVKLSANFFTLLFHFHQEALHQEYRSGLPFPSPVDHILSELSTMTRLSWVALNSLAYSFIELDKAVVHVIRLVSFLWLWFSVCLPSE